MKQAIQVIETTSIPQARDIAGKLLTFRAPHHTTSATGVVDELRLAIDGVLYLDEAGEFSWVTIRRLARVVARGGPLPRAILIDIGVGHLTGSDAAEYKIRLENVIGALRVAVQAADRDDG